MLFYYHNKITSNYQYFRVDHITDHMNPHCHTRFTSLRTVKDFFCSHGQSRMYSYRAFSVLIKDFPNLPKEKKYIEFSGHRFRCISCGETITEDINTLLRALPGKWPGGSSTYWKAICPFPPFQIFTCWLFIPKISVKNLLYQVFLYFPENEKTAGKSSLFSQDRTKHWPCWY